MDNRLSSESALLGGKYLPFCDLAKSNIFISKGRCVYMLGYVSIQQ